MTVGTVGAAPGRGSPDAYDRSVAMAEGASILPGGGG